MMAARIRLAALTFVLVAIATPARSADAAPSVAEWGLRASGGSTFNGRLTHAAILPWVGFSLWEKADRWFASHDIHALWVVQPWIGYVNSVRGSDVAVGVSPLMA